MKKFPEKFLWGSSTASYQVEGGIENNDWAQAAREGKVPVCGRACDHYNLYEQDFDIIQKLGHNTHKISIEWSRIEPEEGIFNEEEIDHYRRVIDSLHRRNIKPIINLWHFTIPIWFSKMGSFQNNKSTFYFARYCKYVTEKLGDKSDTWVTINEPMVWSSGSYLRGQWPPFKKSIFSYLKVIKNLAKAHNTAYIEMKKVKPKIQIGISKNNMYFHSNLNPINIFKAHFMRWFWNRRFLNKINDYQDFIGVNHYFHKKFGDKESYPKSDMGWDIYPPALYHVLIELRRYKKPIIVTENGIADESDTKRGAFIRDYVGSVHKAIEHGVDVRGYLHWSLLDNYEWAFGFEKRFGLVEVNYNTLKRTVRQSAFEYKKICDANAL
ncbi:MAG: glycoside hydrolase family 1 protein [Candidatus Paceibacterota bacterium]